VLQVHFVFTVHLFLLFLLGAIREPDQLVIVDVLAFRILVVGDDCQLVQFFLDLRFKLSLNAGYGLLAQGHGVEHL